MAGQPYLSRQNDDFIIPWNLKGYFKICIKTTIGLQTLSLNRRTFSCTQRCLICLESILLANGWFAYWLVLGAGWCGVFDFISISHLLNMSLYLSELAHMSSPTREFTRRVSNDTPNRVWKIMSIDLGQRLLRRANKRIDELEIGAISCNNVYIIVDWLGKWSEPIMHTNPNRIPWTEPRLDGRPTWTRAQLLIILFTTTFRVITCHKWAQARRFDCTSLTMQEIP